MSGQVGAEAAASSYLRSSTGRQRAVTGIVDSRDGWSVLWVPTSANEPAAVGARRRWLAGKPSDRA
jgi:hypothetical protein